MRLISWNVNGIRAVIRKEKFYSFIEEYNPDVLCLQETKAWEEQVDLDLPSHPYQFWNEAEKKGYSGTAVFSKTKPIKVQNDIGIAHHDKEGRVIAAEYKNFWLVTIYVPNVKRDLSRLQDRQDWDICLLKYLKKLEKTKPVIWCGDLNVAHQEIDLARPKNNVGKHGFTDEERNGFQNFVEAGFVDTFRHFHPEEPDHYTWWQVFGGARERNVGWRIDYFLASKSIISQINSAKILPEVHGSDHCPVMLEL